MDEIGSIKRIIIDVREPNEYALGHVSGAINLPPASLMTGITFLQRLPKNTELIVYCRSGARSATAMYLLHQLGFTNMVNGINQQHVEKNYF